MGKIIGIDLGTTNSVACTIEHGEARVIVNEEGGRITPSVVGFSSDGDRFVGDIAKRQLLMSPETTVYGVKRFMGRRFSDSRTDIKGVTYRIERQGDDEIGIAVSGRSYTPQQISAFILQKLKQQTCS